MATKKPVSVYSGKLKELQSGDVLSYDAIGALATARLVGRTTAGTGALEAISIGSGLSLSAGTLSATGGGLSIGSAVSGGGANRVLYEDGSQNLAASSRFTFNGQTLVVQSENSSQTANILEVNRYDGATALRVDDDTSVTIGGAYDYSNSKHAPGHWMQWAAGGAYSGKGLKLTELSGGNSIRLHVVSGPALYITDDTGSAASLTLGTRINPGDGSTFIASSGRWIISAGGFVVNRATWTGTAQIEAESTSLPQVGGFYDSSNYFTIQAASNGATTFNAVGSGAKFIFSDCIEPPSMADSSAPNNSIYYSTTQNKLVFKDGGGVVNNLY